MNMTQGESPSAVVDIKEQVMRSNALTRPVCFIRSLFTVALALKRTKGVQTCCSRVAVVTDGCAFVDVFPAVNHKSDENISFYESKTVDSAAKLSF